MLFCSLQGAVDADCAVAAAEMLPAQRTVDAHRRRMQQMGPVMTGFSDGAREGARARFTRHPPPDARSRRNGNAVNAAQWLDPRVQSSSSSPPVMEPPPPPLFAATGALSISAYLSASLSVCVSFCMSICMSVCLFSYLFASRSVCMSFCMSVCLFVYLSASLLVCASFCMSICIPV